MSNVIIGEPRFKTPESTKSKTIVDVVMFVAGTTDPINTKGLKHEANTKYWQAATDNYWNKIKELKPQYLDLHIEGGFFSWSGDNDTAERIKAADRLLDLFVRLYPGFKKREVHLHLIGHSHGGNVINEFTNLISTDKRFPEPWKIKSITYLSTPFFKKKHQLNHAKIHSNCKIINVHNEYDITQQFVADFSLINLEILIAKYQKGDFDKALARLKEPDYSIFELLNSTFGRLNNTEGPRMWRATAILLDGVCLLFSAIIKYVGSIETKKFQAEKTQFTGLLQRLLNWATTSRATFIRNQATRTGGYSRGEFFDDLNFLQILRLVNEILAMPTGLSDSYLLGVLEVLFKENTGITDTIEETSWTPKSQTKGLSIEPVNITTSEKYHSRNKKKNFDRFLSGVQAAQRKQDLREVLMRLFSQFITGPQINDIREKISKLEYVITGAEDTQLKTLRNTNLANYQRLVTEYNADLVAQRDQEVPLMIRPGGIPYLATVSHSLSHTQFWEKAKNALMESFSSGKNPGYKKK